jgi:ribosome-associated protein
VGILDDAKAEDVVSIDLSGKSSLADHMLIATGRSQRHVSSIADRVVEDLEKLGLTGIRVEGQPACDWVLIDARDVIVHVFRPEVREFYRLEKLWVSDRPDEKTGA